MLTLYTQDARPDLPKARNVEIKGLQIEGWLRYDGTQHASYILQYGGVAKIRIENKQGKAIYALLRPGKIAMVEPW